MTALPPESVPSPCRDVCRLDTAGVCVGCGRTLAEIEEWPRAERERRLQIRAAAAARAASSSEAAQGSELLDRYPR
jgi:predicted Fe-S protein YdhL (DUF1289 family)